MDYSRTDRRKNIINELARVLHGRQCSHHSYKKHVIK